MGVDWDAMWPRIADATAETLLMVSATLVVSAAFGILLGLALYATRSGSLLANRPVFWALNAVINTVRPIPFIVFVIAVIPLTRAVVGTTIGIWAAIFPMTLVAALSIARIVENNLVSVDRGVIEAGRAMGAGPLRILFTILVPEALGPLVLGFTYILVALIDFSAMAGLVGGGGLGDLAMVYGYQRFETPVMVVTILILIALVQVAQLAGNRLSRQVLRQ